MRTLVLLAVFAGVGVCTEHAVMRYEMHKGAVAPEVQMGSATAGLFAGGTATLIVGTTMFWPRGEGQDR